MINVTNFEQDMIEKNSQEQSYREQKPRNDDHERFNGPRLDL